MKKIILTLILCFTFILNVYGSEVTVTHGTLTTTGVMDEDGGYTYTYAGQYEYGIINVGENIYVDTFQTDGTYKNTYKINIVDEKFGGYVYDGSNHYFLFGNDNPNCSGSTTMYKLIKYNQSFNKVSTLTLRGSQVYAKQIFLGKNGLCDLRVDGEHIFINDVVQEYRYENKNYQNNRSYVVNKNTLKCENTIGGISLGKTGKTRDEVSANMSAEDDNKYYFAVSMTNGIELVEVDPADNESTGNHTVKNLASSALSSYSGDTTMTSTKNRNAVELVGFEAGESNFIVIGTEYGNDTTDEDSDYGTRIFVSTVSKNQVGVLTPTTTGITDYGQISNVKTLKLSSTDIMLMWQDGERISYCHLDGEGKLNGEIRRIYGAELGLTSPYYNSTSDRVVWTYLVNDDDFACYS
ncbi:MAG: hypothetical protein LIO44_03525, partial [Eubacterium sp.]|nr:hypothetical protein [Eubacterium sp.]